MDVNSGKNVRDFSFYYPSLDKVKAQEFGIDLKNIVKKSLAKNKFIIAESDNIFHLPISSGIECRKSSNKVLTGLKFFLIALKTLESEKKKLESQKSTVVKAEGEIETTVNLIADVNINFPDAAIDWSSNLRKKSVPVIRKRDRKIEEFFDC